MRTRSLLAGGAGVATAVVGIVAWALPAPAPSRTHTPELAVLPPLVATADSGAVSPAPATATGSSDSDDAGGGTVGSQPVSEQSPDETPGAPGPLSLRSNTADSFVVTWTPAAGAVAYVVALNGHEVRAEAGLSATLPWPAHHEKALIEVRAVSARGLRGQAQALLVVPPPLPGAVATGSATPSSAVGGPTTTPSSCAPTSTPTGSPTPSSASPTPPADACVPQQTATATPSAAGRPSATPTAAAT